MGGSGVGKAEGEGQGGLYIQNPVIDGSRLSPAKKGQFLPFVG